MTTELSHTPQEIARTMEQVIINGDLAKLAPQERVTYYLQLCEAVGINPLGRPFLYIVLNNKLTLYATKDCTDQLRKRDGVSIQIANREVVEGVYVVTARATLTGGRFDESTGAVPVDKLVGEARANAYMKAETKAKRRVTLSICGLGMLDESEVGSIPGGQMVDGDPLADMPSPPPIAVIRQRQQHADDEAPLFSAAPPVTGTDDLIVRLKAIRSGATSLGLEVRDMRATYVRAMSADALQREIATTRGKIAGRVQECWHDMPDVPPAEFATDLDALADAELIALAADVKRRHGALIAA